jgi:hypothetical protein
MMRPKRTGSLFSTSACIDCISAGRIEACFEIMRGSSNYLIHLQGHYMKLSVPRIGPASTLRVDRQALEG